MPDQNPPSIVRPRRRRRLRRRLGLAALVLLGGLTALYHVVTEPNRLRRICEDRLRRMVDGAVRIEHARFSFFDGLELSGVSIAGVGSEGATSSPPDARHPDLYFRTLYLQHNPLAIIGGKWVVEEVTVSDAICHVVRNESGGNYNLSRLFRLPAQRRAPGTERLPVAKVRDAVLVFSRQSEAGRREVERVGISATALPAPNEPGALTLVWKTAGPEGTSGRSRLTLDPFTLTDLEGGSPWMSLETAMLGAEARADSAGNWFNLLGIAGEIRAHDYSVSTGAKAGPPRVTIRLRDAALSVPIDKEEQGLPPEERYLRFEHVQGEIEVCGDTAEADFTGRFHEADCRVSASLSGEGRTRANLGDVGFHVELKCDGLDLPSGDPAIAPVEARFVRRWRPLRSFFNDFDPHGRVSIDIAASKAPGADEHAHLDWGRIDVHDADAAYRGFPYRVSRLRGRVDLDQDGIHLRKLNGDHEGAPIIVRGSVREPRWQTAVDLNFSGQGVKLNTELRDALSPRFRSIWDQFDLSGTADLEVSMSRAGPTGDQPAPWLTTVEGAISDGQARFAGFPYPVSGLHGNVRVTPSRIEVSRLAGHNGDAQVSVEGYAQLGPAGPSEMELRLDAKGVVFNDQLMAALPDGSREAVAAFSPQGKFDLSGRIAFEPGSRSVVYDLVAAIRDTSVRHRDLPATVKDVSGDIRIEPHRVVLERLTGRRGLTRIAVTGAVAAAAGRVDAQAEIRCEALQLDEELLAALPLAAAEVCRNLHLEGSLNTITTVGRRGPRGAESTRQRTVIEADGVALKSDAFPLPLTDVRGTVTVEAGRIAIDHLQAASGDGRLSVHGTVIHAGPAIEADLVLRADHIALDEALRQAVSWRLRRLWNNITPSGRFDLDLDRLHYTRTAADSTPRWDFSGRLQLSDVGLDVGARIGGSRGSLVGQGALVGAPPSLELSAAVALERLTVNGKPLEHLRGRAEASVATGTMALREIQADLCGGRVTGEVQLFNAEGDSGYEMAATLQDVDLAEFINAGRAEHEPPKEASGRMDAHLFIAADGSGVDERRGGGRVLVRQGQLYSLPLVSAVRAQARVHPSDDSAFQELSAQFFIAGPQVELRDLVLQGRGLAFIGAGNVSPRDGALDLTLVAVSPREWVKVPVLTEFLEGASRELVEISVRGTLAAPQIATRPLRGVEAALDTLFRKRATQNTAPNR